MRRLCSTLIGWWSEHPWIDYILAVAFVGLHILAIRISSHGDFMVWIKLDQRLGVYETGATAISVLGGLSAIAASIYVAANGERARKVRLFFKNALRRNWTFLLINVGISVILCLASQVLDNERDPHSARFVFEYAMALGIFGFGRLVWLFDAIIAISHIDADGGDMKEPPALNPIWESKLQGKSSSER